MIQAGGEWGKWTEFRRKIQKLYHTIKKCVFSFLHFRQKLRSHMIQAVRLVRSLRIVLVSCWTNYCRSPVPCDTLKGLSSSSKALPSLVASYDCIIGSPLYNLSQCFFSRHTIPRIPPMSTIVRLKWYAFPLLILLQHFAIVLMGLRTCLLFGRLGSLLNHYRLWHTSQFCVVLHGLVTPCCLVCPAHTIDRQQKKSCGIEYHKTFQCIYILTKMCVLYILCIR